MKEGESTMHRPPFNGSPLKAKSRLGAHNRDRATVAMTTNTSNFEEIDIYNRDNIQNAGLTGKKFSKRGNEKLRETN